jgi:hypothetical protein
LATPNWIIDDRLDNMASKDEDGDDRRSCSVKVGAPLFFAGGQLRDPHPTFAFAEATFWR